MWLINLILKLTTYLKFNNSETISSNFDIILLLIIIIIIVYHPDNHIAKYNKMPQLTTDDISSYRWFICVI